MDHELSTFWTAASNYNNKKNRKKNMKSIFLSALFACSIFFAKAQNVLTLKDAVETGIKNNIDVLQSDLLMQKADINLKQ
jgi:hypothetical protein